MGEIREASPSSTLAKYTEYCNSFMEELDKREKKYKGKTGEFNR